MGALTHEHTERPLGRGVFSCPSWPLDFAHGIKRLYYPMRSLSVVSDYVQDTEDNSRLLVQQPLRVLEAVSFLCTNPGPPTVLNVSS